MLECQVGAKFRLKKVSRGRLEGHPDEFIEKIVALLKTLVDSGMLIKNITKS